MCVYLCILGLYVYVYLCKQFSTTNLLNPPIPTTQTPNHSRYRSTRRLALRLQALRRGQLTRRAHARQRAAAIRLQCAWRRVLAQKRREGLQRARAAVRVQSAYRGWVAWVAFARRRAAAVRVQAAVRCVRFGLFRVRDG